MYGFGSNECKFFESYLKSRGQVTVIKNELSNMAEIRCGVPQGSILGPLLFLIYINDLPNCLLDDEGEILMFADDRSLIIKDETSKFQTADRTTTVIDKARDWFDANNLILNVNKTGAMHLSLKQPTHPDPVIMALTKRQIEIKENCKFLGVTVDRILQWSTHIEGLCKKLNSSIYAVRKIRETCGECAAKSVYHAYFHSIMTYGILCWGAAADSEFSRVFILQKRAVRAIRGLKPRDSCRDLFKELRILTLPCTYIYECLLYARKNMMETPLNSELHEYNTRHGNTVRPIKHRLTKMSKSFVVLSVRLYNKLPQQIREATNESFRKVVKTYLLDRAFYNLHEFISQK
jgi:hypothetical protein